MPKLWECCRSTPWFIVEINRVGVVLYQGTIPSEGAEGPRSYSAVKELLFLWEVQLERPKYIQWKLQLNTTRNEIQSRLHSRHPFHALQSSWLVVIVIVMSEDEWTISPDYSALLCPNKHNSSQWNSGRVFLLVHYTSSWTTWSEQGSLGNFVLLRRRRTSQSVLMANN